jgi:UDP-2-acetamido-2,6-beta-L-arabino-hexul-4-ose reductase
MRINMIKVGITGQSGFLGTHLYNTLGLYSEEFIRVPFLDDFFQDEQKLSEFVKQCDVVVHLAAVNRHNNPELIYDTNIALVKKLIDALEHTKHCPHVLYSSSIQEDIDNLYGRSKKEGRVLLAEWAEKSNTPFTGFVFPNIFGPFGDPYYNSFIATFSHQLTHGETPKIDIDKTVPLLYVADAVKIIIDATINKSNKKEYRISPSAEKKVIAILETLKIYRTTYFEKGIIPELKDKFEINLFNTFRTYFDIKQHNPVNLKLNIDERGSFVETVKTQLGGQFSFSTTKPGITRGNHYHTRKIERFTVIKGNALIQLRRIGTKEGLEFELNGNEPSFVDMPIWYTHNITNIGEEPLFTLFWVNEFFDPDDPDTYFEKV